MSLAPILLSFEVAVLATAIAAFIGVALAGFLASRRSVLADFFDVLVTAPMIMPPTVLGYYLLLVVGRTGPIGQAYESLAGGPIVFTRKAAVLAAAIAALPFIVKATRAAMEEVDPSLLGAAATLGAPPLRVFFTVVLPLSRSGILAGVSIGFARALGDFGVTLMLAGNIPGLTQTASLAIYDAVQANRQAVAASTALVMTVAAVAALYLANKLARRRRNAF